MARVRKQPLRTCVACKTGADKHAFVRMVRVQGNSLDVQQVCTDPTGRQAGRGAYICKRPECFERARKTKALERALRCSISIDNYERLALEFCNLCTADLHNVQPHNTEMVENA